METFIYLVCCFVGMSWVNCANRNYQIRKDNKKDGGDHKILRVIRSWKDLEKK